MLDIKDKLKIRVKSEFKKAELEKRFEKSSRTILSRKMLLSPIAQNSKAYRTPHFD